MFGLGFYGYVFKNLERFSCLFCRNPFSYFLSRYGIFCGTCYGDPNSSAVNGMNWAIISLLVTTGGVLSGSKFFNLQYCEKIKKYNKSKEV